MNQLSLDRGHPGSGGAWFSPCETYRYLLWRKWGEGPRCVFAMLNPSTADATKDDPTIRRCIGFARAWGFEGVEIVNLFALRSTDPRALYDEADFVDPVGHDNDSHILSAAGGAAKVVCAWGNHGLLLDRGPTVLRTLLAAGVQPWCFGLTKLAQPAHPLYQPSDRKLVRLESSR